MTEKPKLHRRIIIFIVECWRLVMDNRFNPLRYIPDPSLQMYFTLVLFVMWSFYFGLVAAYWGGIFGNYNTIVSLIVHIAVVVPIAFTNAIFLDAERNGDKWHADWIGQHERWKFWNKVRQSNYEKRIKWDIDKEA